MPGSHIPGYVSRDSRIPPASAYCNSNFIAGRPKAALLFWFFGGFRCGVSFFIVMLVIY